MTDPTSSPIDLSLKELGDRLMNNPLVTGMVRYGGRLLDDQSSGGDLDLFLFLDARPVQVESLHFFCRDIPVDLNIRALADLRRSEPLAFIDIALISGEILYDPTAALATELPLLRNRWPASPASLSESHATRFHQSHVLDKVRGRLQRDPVLCHFLLSSNVLWLLETYFRVRGMGYLGEVAALDWLQDNDEEAYAAIRAFYGTPALWHKLAVIERLTDIVLNPIGGVRRREEILVLAAGDQTEGFQQCGSVS
mgnify:CR=1 FL=1